MPFINLLGTPPGMGTGPDQSTPDSSCKKQGRRYVAQRDRPGETVFRRTLRLQTTPANITQQNIAAHATPTPTRKPTKISHRKLPKLPTLFSPHTLIPLSPPPPSNQNHAMTAGALVGYFQSKAQAYRPRQQPPLPRQGTGKRQDKRKAQNIVPGAGGLGSNV